MTTQFTPVSRTPLHAWHVTQGVRIADDNGWQIPTVYSSTEREIASARSGVALADISAFAKISLQGAGIDSLVQALIGLGPPLQPLRVAALDIANPALACRLTADSLLLLASTTSVAGLEERLASLPKNQMILQTDVTTAYAGFCLVGPKTEDVLQRVTALDVRPTSFPEGACAETSLAGIQALLVRPPGIFLPSMRIHVSWDLAEYAWEELLKAGRAHGLTPLGMEAWKGLSNLHGSK